VLHEGTHSLNCRDQRHEDWLKLHNAFDNFENLFDEMPRKVFVKHFLILVEPNAFEIAP